MAHLLAADLPSRPRLRTRSLDDRLHRRPGAALRRRSRSRLGTDAGGEAVAAEDPVVRLRARLPRNAGDRADLLRLLRREPLPRLRSLSAYSRLRALPGER